VDDEPGLVRLLTLMLKARYEILVEVDATRAFEVALHFKPHLILLDWVMPAMHGGDVAEQIRADPRLGGTRILFLTAVVSKRDPPGEMAGFPAIGKPTGLKELVEAIEQQMSGAGWSETGCSSGKR